MKSSKTNITDKEYSCEVTTYPNVGVMVRDLREKKGISLRTFASTVEVSPAYISFLERNKLKSPPSEHLVRRMANVLEADENEMLALARRMSGEFISIISKYPRQMSALLASVKDLPPEDIQALTIEALRRWEINQMKRMKEVIEARCNEK